MEFFAVAAIIISALVFIHSVITNSKKADQSYTSQLERQITALDSRIEKLEDQLEDCSKQRAQLQEENISLMTRVVQLQSRLEFAAAD